MIYPQRIVSIRPGDRVLDVGPGGFPHPRADVYLDRRFDEATAAMQRGFAARPDIDRPQVFYDGGRFPFDDHAFDYTICSHVLEHVPDAELDTFIAELQRVSPRGYIEFPSVFYEFPCFPQTHRWFINVHGGEILLLDKNAFQSSWLHRIYREMVYCADRWMLQAYRRYPELFFIGFEWTDSIRYRRVRTFDELVTEADYERFREFFASKRAPMQPRLMLHKTTDLAQRAVRKAIRLATAPLKEAA